MPSRPPCPARQRRRHRAIPPGPPSRPARHPARHLSPRPQPARQHRAGRSARRHRGHGPVRQHWRMSRIPTPPPSRRHARTRSRPVRQHRRHVLHTPPPLSHRQATARRVSYVDCRRSTARCTGHRRHGPDTNTAAVRRHRPYPAAFHRRTPSPSMLDLPLPIVVSRLHPTHQSKIDPDFGVRVAGEPPARGIGRGRRASGRRSRAAGSGDLPDEFVRAGRRAWPGRRYHRRRGCSASRPRRPRRRRPEWAGRRAGRPGSQR
jgi:hypothetical protein